MSDFDDLPDWLKGDGDDEQSSTPDNQPNWDLPPSNDSDTPAHFGGTGALPWRQGASDDPNRQTSDLEDMDWDALGGLDEGSDADDLAWMNEGAFPEDTSTQSESEAGFSQWLDDDGALDEPDFDIDDFGTTPPESAADWFGAADSFGEEEPSFFEDTDTAYDKGSSNWFDDESTDIEEPSFLHNLEDIEGELEPEDLDGLLLDFDDDLGFEFEETPPPQQPPQEPKIRRLGAKKQEEREGDLTFEEWERQQEQQEFETDHAEELAIQADVPDWFRDNVELGDAAGDELASILIPDLEEPSIKAPAPQAEVKTDYVPEWFMGLEEHSLDDAPDWIKEATSGADLSSLTDISAFVPPEPEPEPTPEPKIEMGDDVPDWFKGIGVDLPEIDTPTVAAPTSGFDLPDLTGLPDLSAPVREITKAAPTSGFGIPDDLGLPDLTEPVREVSKAAPTSGFAAPEDLPAEDDQFDFLGMDGGDEALEAGDVPEWLRGYAPVADTGIPQAEALVLDDVSDADMDWLDDLSAVELTDEQVDFSDLAKEIPRPTQKQPDRDILAGTGSIDDLLGFVDSTTASPLVPIQSDRRVLAQEAQLTDLFDGVDDNLLQALDAASERTAAPAPTEDQPELALADMNLIAELRQEQAVKLRAGGIELDFTEQPLSQLPDELRNLHGRVGAPSPTAEMPTVGPLAGVTSGLGIVGLTSKAGTPGLVTHLNVTNDQLARIEALTAVLELDRANEWQFEDEDRETEVEAKPRRRARRQAAKRKPDRFLITLLLLAALIGPFLTENLHISEEPNTQKLAVEQQAVLTAVSGLQNRDRVLVAFEYGPTAAGELNALAEAVLYDIMRQGAIPVVLSTNPLGTLNAQNVIQGLTDENSLLDSLERDQALQVGQDYHILRYISGGAVAIRGLTSSPTLAALIFSTDNRGESTNLDIGTVDASDFAMVVVVSETTEDVRNWAEQFNVEGLPKYALVTAAIEPLAQAYVGPAYGGYLAGYRDTYRYNQLRNPQLTHKTQNDLPDRTVSQWHSMALGVLVAGLVIILGTIVNLLRGLRRRRA